MALTESELKTMLLTELGATNLESEIDTVWSSWWILANESVSSGTVTEQRLRVRILSFLQGKYRTYMNLTQGTERREAKALFDNVTKMMEAAEAKLAKIDSGYTAFTLKALRVTPYTATQDALTSAELLTG